MPSKTKKATGGHVCRYCGTTIERGLNEKLTYRIGSSGRKVACRYEHESRCPDAYHRPSWQQNEMEWTGRVVRKSIVDPHDEPEIDDYSFEDTIVDWF
jgi:hypothetical protein